ncbi:hypothetical protein [Falsirhodobacter sp. 1013]|uniref:hypothetical protein n=1 Tax=Falsirhodobacter sp. 1013 TaxID=3417566 RepID=UPI003EB9029C
MDSLTSQQSQHDPNAGIEMAILAPPAADAWEAQERELLERFGFPAPQAPAAPAPPAPTPHAAAVPAPAPPAPAPAARTTAPLARPLGVSVAADRGVGLTQYVAQHFNGSEAHPSYRQKEDVDLAHRPKQMAADALDAMKPHDLSAYPRAKGNIIILSNAKQAESPDTPLAFSIPLQREGRQIFVEFKPDLGAMTRGTVAVEGSDREEEVEFDFVREQWTTPAQNASSFATMNVIIQSQFQNMMSEDDVEAMSSDSVAMQMRQIVRVAERSVAQFHRGEISYADLLKELNAREADLYKFASDKKSRDKSRRRQYLLALMTASVGLGSLIFLVYRFTANAPSSPPAPQG